MGNWGNRTRPAAPPATKTTLVLCFATNLAAPAGPCCCPCIALGVLFAIANAVHVHHNPHILRSYSDKTKTEHLEYTAGAPAHLHKITFRPASSATMAEDTSQGEDPAHKGGDVRRPRFDAL